MRLESSVVGHLVVHAGSLGALVKARAFGMTSKTED